VKRQKGNKPLFLVLSNILQSLHPEICLFANGSSSNAYIMVLPKLTFVLLSFFHYHVAVTPLHGFMEELVTAVIAEVFITLSFCLKRMLNREEIKPKALAVIELRLSEGTT